MVHSICILYFMDKNYDVVVEVRKYPTSFEKLQGGINDILGHNVPIGLVEQGTKTVWVWCII